MTTAANNAATAATTATVTTESRDGIFVVTLNRPEVRNAWNEALVAGLHHAWLAFAADEARVCVLRANGPVFSAGVDLKSPPRDALAAMPNLSVPCNKPIIAAVEGAALGVACSLVLMCDIVIAAEPVKLTYLEAQIGIFQGLMGGCLGRMQYKPGLQWMLTGDPMTARRACEIGMVNEVVGSGEALDRAMAIAQRIARNAPLVVQTMKGIAMHTLPRGPIETGYALQAGLKAIAASDDKLEGLAAFRERRPAVFKGR